jgi:hypothetical protein
MSRRESERFRTTWRSMATEALEDRFEQLNLWRSGDKRAPHKPLLILLAALAVSTVAWPIPALVRLSSNIRKPVCVLVDPLEPCTARCDAPA